MDSAPRSLRSVNRLSNARFFSTPILASSRSYPRFSNSSSDSISPPHTRQTGSHSRSKKFPPRFRSSIPASSPAGAAKGRTRCSIGGSPNSTVSGLANRFRWTSRPFAGRSTKVTFDWQYLRRSSTCVSRWRAITTTWCGALHGRTDDKTYGRVARAMNTDIGRPGDWQVISGCRVYRHGRLVADVKPRRMLKSLRAALLRRL